jgi:MFS family permease
MGLEGLTGGRIPGERADAVGPSPSADAVAHPVATHPVSKVAVPFLGLLGAVQGSCPNIASTALVGASRTLHMAGSTQALAASIETLAIAATAISTGLLADRLGRRLVLMAALVVGAVGNLLVVVSPTPVVYMLGMAIAGVGLGAVYGAAFGYLKAVVPAGRMAGAMGVFTAVVMASTVVLTFVGGTLASAHWRLAFVLIPVMCAACVLLTPVLLPRVERVRGSRPDLPGQGLLMGGVILFLYSVSQFAHSLISLATLVPLVLGTLLLVAFVRWEARYEHHFFPVELLRSPLFLAALCAGFIYNFGTAVSFLQVTNLWQYVDGLTTSKVSVWQLPLLLAGIASGLATGRLISRGVSNRTAVLVGGIVSASGFTLLALAHDAHGLLGFLPGLVLTGAGVIIAAVPFGNLIMTVAPARYLGPVTSSRTTVGQFFYTLGFSISAVVVDRLTTGGVVHRLEHAGVPANQLSTGMDAVTVYAAKSTAPTTSLGRQALHDAAVSYGHAFSTMLLIAAGLMLAAGIAAFALMAGGEQAPDDSPVPAGERPAAPGGKPLPVPV